MAKRDDDDDFDASEAEVEEAAEIADADDEVAEAAEDDAEVADADAEDYEDEPYEEEKPRLKPKVTMLTLVLCLLNVLAALGFVFMLMLNYDRRQAYTFLAAQQEFQLIGAGTLEDREGETAGEATLPAQKLSSQELKAAHAERRVGPASGEFSPVENGIRFQLNTGDLAPEVLKEWMSDVGEPVGTIEEEFNRLQKKLPGEIQAAADKVVENYKKADDATKQNKVLSLLYPLCLNPMQVQRLEKKVRGDANKVPATLGAPLDQMLKEAVERRILADILIPVEMFRPSAPDRRVLENVADVNEVKLDDVRKLLSDRLSAAASDKYDGGVHFGEEWNGQKRWTIEKRQNGAFLLLCLALTPNYAQLEKGAKFEDRFLNPKGLERAQRISGIYDFTAACKAYNDVAKRLEKRIADAIALDREGFYHQVANEMKRSVGFADKHAELIFRIRQVQIQIATAEKRLEDLKGQRDRAAKLVEERTDHKVKVEKQIVQDRAATAKRVAELRELQQQLHRALVELADAAEANAQLADSIRRLSGVKGAQP